MLGTSIVVAQEESEGLEVMRLDLHEAGYDALTATDGVAAYQAIEKGNPVAVILDLNLPGMTGFRLVKLLRQDPRWRHVPLIVTSAYSFEEVEEIANEGVDGFLARPFTTKDLVSRLEYALARNRGMTA